MRLIWSRHARNDLFDIAVHYDGITAGLGDEILGRIDDATHLLPTFPRMGSPTHQPGVRKLLIAKTPFLLFYAVSRERVEVRRVVHAQSDWQHIR